MAAHLKKPSRSKMATWLIREHLAKTRADAEVKLVALSLCIFIISFYIALSSINIASAARNITEKYGDVNQKSYAMNH